MFCALTVLLTNMLDFSSWTLCCSPDVLHEQEETGLLSADQSHTHNTQQSSLSGHLCCEKRKSEGVWVERYCPLPHPANFHLLTDIWIRPAGVTLVISSPAFRTQIAWIHKYSGCSEGWTGSGHNLTGCLLFWPGPNRRIGRVTVCDGKSPSHFFPSRLEWVSGVPVWNFSTQPTTLC